MNYKIHKIDQFGNVRVDKELLTIRIFILCLGILYTIGNIVVGLWAIEKGIILIIPAVCFTMSLVGIKTTIQISSWMYDEYGN